MCGRYLNRIPAEEIGRIFAARFDPGDYPARYNAAPTQLLPVVRFNAETRERQIDLLRWGLIPIWAKDKTIGNTLINARVETAATKPAFRDAFAKRRCLVPASGFYEWKKTPQGKVPQAILPNDDGLFAFAGLWERWKDLATQEIVRSFTILTGKPNSLVAPIHDRMPVILLPEHWPLWLGEVPADRSALETLIAEPYPAQLMRAYAIGARVNSVKNDDAELLAPAG